MSVFVGVDSGGTKTQVIMLDVDKHQAISLMGHAGNPNTVGWERAGDTVKTLVFQGLEALSMSLADLKSLSIGMAGIDIPEQRIRAEAEFSKYFPNTLFEVANDAFAALSAGTEGRPGVVLIAGTGSIAIGENSLGVTARAGGYGNLIGDEGSGFDIGRKGIMAAIQACEGRGPQTMLVHHATDFFGIRRVEELIANVYESDYPIQVVASFAPEVLQLVDTDEISNQIVAEAIESYVQLVQSVYRQLGVSEMFTKREFDNARNDSDFGLKTVLTGGLFKNNEVLVDRLRKRQPSQSFNVLRCKVAAGGVLRAIKLFEEKTGRPAEENLAIWKQMVVPIE